VLADTSLRPRDGGGGGSTLPIFSTGSELARALAGVPLRALESYEQRFADGGPGLLRTAPFGSPRTWLFVREAS